MKIAFMVYDRPNYFGGPTTNARRLLPELQRRGHQVCALFFYHRDAPTSRYLSERGVACRSLNRYKQTTEKQIRWILNQLAEFEPDVFVPNIFVSGWFASRWVRAAGIPTIAAHRSDDAYYWDMVEEFVVGRPQWSVSGLVCVNDAVRQRVRALEPRYTQLCTIPSGVPLPDLPTHPADCKQGPLSLAYVGRLVQTQKRIRETIDAIARVARDIPDLTATIYGEGSEREFLERQVADLGLSQRVHFYGSIPNEKLHQQLCKHHILVLLSDYEGTPGAVMDGMACGLVPVCLDIPGGVRELVRHERTGLLVSDRDQNFANAIHKLRNSPELLRELSQNARSHVAEGYSLEVAASRWESFSTKLLATAGPRRSIRQPVGLHLPPVRPALGREDIRMPSPPTRLHQKVREISSRFKRALPRP